jgi:hypothetical protein
MMVVANWGGHLSRLISLMGGGGGGLVVHYANLPGPSAVSCTIRSENGLDRFAGGGRFRGRLPYCTVKFILLATVSSTSN